MTCLVALMAAAPTAGLAADAGIADALSAWPESARVVLQRKDVDEVSRPQPQSGPATPVPFCGPGDPICP